MSKAADKAYAAAQRLIAKAKASGARRLDLNNRALTHLPPEIGILTALTMLDLSGTQISDIAPITPLTALTKLDLSNTPVSDLAPLTPLTALTGLDLSFTRVTDLSPLVALTALTTLYLRGTKVSDLTPIKPLTSLIILDLSRTPVTDITPLTRLTALTTLFILYTPITDPRPLLHLTKMATEPRFGGLTFTDSPFAALPEFAGIAEIEDPAERAQRLFAALEGWVPKGEVTETTIEAALKGPILSDSLVDVTKQADRFEATSLVDGPERAADTRHDDLLGTMQFAAKRLARTEAHNRIGAAVVTNFRDYADYSSVSPLNPRVLNYLANGIRVAVTDADLAASLDAFDTSALTGFLAEHDAFIRDYYPSSLIGPVFDVETSADALIAELFPKLASAKEILRQADADGLFAPSVSNALEMLERRAEGARRKLATSGDPNEIKLADQDLRRNSVLVTAYLGRINGRLKQWLFRQAKMAQDDPVDGALRMAGLVQAAQMVVQQLKPVFDALWHLIGNIPLPF